MLLSTCCILLFCSALIDLAPIIIVSIHILLKKASWFQVSQWIICIIYFNSQGSPFKNILFNRELSYFLIANWVVELLFYTHLLDLDPWFFSIFILMYSNGPRSSRNKRHSPCFKSIPTPRARQPGRVFTRPAEAWGNFPERKPGWFQV